MTSALAGRPIKREINVEGRFVDGGIDVINLGGSHGAGKAPRLIAEPSVRLTDPET